MSTGIRFSQMTSPALEVGDYEIKVEQVTNLKVSLATEKVNITVATERFNISNGQIYSVYPPENAVGDYSECLPNIVLKRRTLPWEMKLNNEKAEMPWMMLLVLDETDEYAIENSDCQTALAPETKTFVPNLKLESYEKPESPCTFVTLPKVLFSALVPYEDDLCLLAHGKGVSLDYKVTDETVNDDWFATVVTNRFCLMPIDKTHAISHTAMLVSLEGFETCLKDAEQREKALSEYDAVRMIVLTSWHFSMAKPLFDFGSVFTNLDAGMMETPYTYKRKKGKKKENEELKMMCKQGYYPMNHHMRDGSQTVSWYQSPLIPYFEPQTAFTCSQFADQLLCYDPERSLFDVRYASAWQIGKSMGLADRGFAQKLFEWRMTNQNALKSALYHQSLLHYVNTGNHKALKNEIGSMQTHQILKNELNASFEEAIMEVLKDANKTSL